MAYGPLGHSKTDLLAHPEVAAIAEEVGRSPAQVPSLSKDAMALVSFKAAAYSNLTASVSCMAVENLSNTLATGMQKHDNHGQQILSACIAFA